MLALEAGHSLGEDLRSHGSPQADFRVIGRTTTPSAPHLLRSNNILDLEIHDRAGGHQLIRDGPNMRKQACR